jgi:hypothetical protein
MLNRPLNFTAILSLYNSNTEHMAHLFQYKKANFKYKNRKAAIVKHLAASRKQTGNSLLLEVPIPPYLFFCI